MSNLFRISALVCAVLLSLNTPAGGGAAHEGTFPTAPLVDAAEQVGISNATDLKIVTRKLDDVTLEVVAVDPFAAPGVTVKFMLRDGAEISFAMPERPETVYTFSNTGSHLAATATKIAFSKVAQID